MSATEKVTRVELIDHRFDAPNRGRCFVAYGVAVELSYQDQGRTLKVFIDDLAAPSTEPPSAT